MQNVGCHNMRPLYLISLILLFSGCAKIPDKLSMDVDFGGDYSVKLKIKKNFEDGYLTFLVQEYGEKKLLAFDSVLLTSRDFYIFFKMLDTVSLLNIPYDTLYIPTDAITVWVKINQDGNTNDFISISRGDPSFRLFKYALMDLLNRKLPKQDYYIEDLERDLGTNKSTKIKSKDPFVVKMCDRLSSRKENELKELFRKVPKDKSVIIDMTKFGIMDDILKPYFKSFDSSHPKAIWVIQEDRRMNLAVVGIDTLKMVKSLDIAKKIIFD